MKTLGIGCAALLVILGLAILSFAGNWFNAGVKIISPDNVRAQWQFAYDYNESLKAIAVQDCIAEKAVKAATSDNERVQRQTQQIAIENNYARVKAEYDGRLRDAFRGGIVAPPDIPHRAPTLEENKAAYC